MEWLITFLIVLPGAVMAANRSSWLLDYTIVVMAFNREIRRMVDFYYNGYFNPQSAISLTPLLVGMLMLIPGVVNSRGIPSRARVPLEYLAYAIAMGLVVGLVRNRFAAIYSLAEWLTGIATMAFAASQNVNRRVADRWVRTAGYSAIVVAAYGVWQYYTIPPWDAMWLVQSGMAGYMGQPEPTKMTVFSTLNERGPCGAFLAWAAIPMILSKRWRPIGGWFVIALLLWVMVLTQTRSSLILVAMISLLFPALSSGQGVFRIVLLAVLMMLGFTWGLDKIPGMSTINDRFESENMYGEGSSFRSRLNIYESAVHSVMMLPLGRGLGSSGMGKRAEEALGNSVETLGDSGYIQMFVQFGWIGGGLFFSAMWKMWKELSRNWRTWNRFSKASEIDPFVMATRAIFVGSMVFLFVGDVFAGFSLMWVFFGRALSPYTHWGYHQAPRGRRGSHQVVPVALASS